MHQFVARIVQCALADRREALAWRAAEHHVYSTITDPGCAAYVGTRKMGHAAADCLTSRKIELMHRSVNRVDLHRRCHIETSLLKAKAKATSTSEQVDTQGAIGFRCCLHALTIFMVESLGRVVADLVLKRPASTGISTAKTIKTIT